MKICKCYSTHEIYTQHPNHPDKVLLRVTEVCNGTRERDVCNCGGDESKCNFYPEKRAKYSSATKVSLRRASKHKYYLDIAAEVAKRSTCLRRQYGAIIVKNDEIIATGYNGAPRGEENCCDKGYCWREANNIPHGEQYEKCVAVHAEMNAIISAARKDMIGGTLYLAGWENGKRIDDAKPCAICAKLIKNAGISRVISQEDATNEIRGIMTYHD